jgi:energy-coupling factor transporter ATP-binding protein EcfA2
MMELRRIALVNWHLFDFEDIEVSGNVGILGENRSGKSTILDMVQVVLTGASKTYLRLNAVAGEASKTRSSAKRSVLSYCLGTLNDGDVRRSETLTYVALGFEDRDGLRLPITIGLAIEARQTESSETILGRFVVIGKLLTTADFTETKADGLYAAHWDNVKSRIISSVGSASFINHRDKAIDFVREYMRRLVPSLPNAEQSASAMLKAVVNAMTLNQGYSATEFVRRFILEDNPINIRDLRNSIETYRSVSATIVTLREKLDALRELREFVTAFEESWGHKALEDWLASRARWLASRADNRSIKEQIAEARRFIDADKEDRDIALEGISEAEQEIERIRKAIAAHEARSGRDQWLETLRSATSEVDRLRKEVNRKRVLAVDIAIATMSHDINGVMAAFCKLAGGPDTLQGRAELRDAEERFRGGARTIAAAVEERYRAVAAQTVSLGQDVAAIRKLLDEAHERGSAAYLSPETKLLLRRLESQKMDARPLCDLLDIVDPNWAAAAEALLGRDREAVFVRRQNIREATVLFRDGRREFRGASLVSLNKLSEFSEAPRPGTFPALFRSADPDVLAFLQRRYGNVRLATTLEEFNHPGRAIMQDGLYDDGLVRSHRNIDPRNHKIGKAAQAAQLSNLSEEFADKAGTLMDLETESKGLARALSALDLFNRQDTERLADMLSAIDECSNRVQAAQDRVTAIDAAGDDGLRERLRIQKAFQDRKKEELRAIDERSNRHQIDVAVGERALKGGEGAEGSAINLSIAKLRYHAQRKLYQYPEASGVYRQRLKALRRPSDDHEPARFARAEAQAHRKLSQQAIIASERAAVRNHQAELDARRALHVYFNNPKFGVSSQVGPESPLLTDIKPWMSALISDIEGNELRRYEDKAKEASERASVLFRGEFVNALNARVSKMERDLETLNRSLKGHPFHNEVYSFHRTAEAQFQPILKIIEISRISDEALDALFKPDVPDDFPHKDTVKAVEQLLEDPDKDVTAFEDYRNFYAFEIHMEDVNTKARTRWETRRNTGSGAEQQVPLYVAIGASLAAVYGSASTHRGQRGMSPALFDEAFSKMDGKNQRAMMSFYADLGLQVIVAAPLEKKPTIIGYMHSLVEIDRIDERSFANVLRVGERAREEILAMNPETLTDAEIAARLAAE